MPTALITAGASIAGAALTSSAASKAARRTQASLDANTALAREQYEFSRGQLTPYIDRGSAADQRIAAFLGLGDDDEAAHRAFQDFLDSSGYRFQVDQGTRAVTASKAAAGMLNSGSTLKALQTYGQNTARSYLGNYLDQLGNVANRGAGSASALSGARQQLTSTTSQNNLAATDAANAASNTRTTALNGLLGSALGAYGDWAGANAYPTPKFKF